jgi:solute carrier family 44 protein 1 (choline transporter-like protein)
VPIIAIELNAVTAYLTYAIIITSFTVILVLVLIAMRKRIGLVIRLFAESQKVLITQPFLFLIPVTTMIILIMFLTYWILTSFMIYSFDAYDTNDKVFFNIKIERKILTIIIKCYHIIALIWITNFIFGCQNMVITGSVANWYFTRDKSQFRSSILKTISNLIVFHMGSIALGSFLITLLKIPRYILMWLQDKIKNTGNSTIQSLSKACICCFWCVEKFLKFINANAYTIISIEGVSFCTAAQKAFSIIVENSFRMATINSVGDFLLFLAKISVSSLTLLLGVFLLDVPINDVNMF